MKKTAEDINKEAHIIAYDVIKATASWLENPDNEIYSLLEEDNKSLEIAANACVEASNILKKALVDIQLVSGIEEKKADISEAIETLSSVANDLDSSGNPELQKKASMLDEILLTIAADVNEQQIFKDKMIDKINQIKRKAEENKKVVTATEPAQKKSEVNLAGQTFAPNELPLSTRYCPEHPGVQVYRKGDGIVQCSLDGKIYDYNEGFTTMKGNKVPGSSVSNQTGVGGTAVSNPMFVDDSRDSRGVGKV